MTFKGYISYIYALLFLVCSSFLSSCNKEEIAVAIGYPVEVNVTEKSNTKISTNGTNLFWDEGDKLALLAVSNNTLATGSATLELNSIDGGSSTGKFKGEVGLSAEPSICYFTYPYTISASLTEEVVSANFDYSNQNGLHNPFLWGKAAYPNDGIMNCTLSHIGGMLKLTNIPAEVTSLTIKGNTGEALTPVTVNLMDGTFSVGSTREFTVDITESTAYICMPPVNFAKGFSIVFHSTSGNMYKSYSTDGGAESGYNFTAGSFITIDIGGTFTPFDVISNATYTHTTVGGFLTGTQVTATATLEGAPSKVTKWRADLIHPDGNTVVRTLTIGNTFSASVMSVVGDWVYLPSGTYTLKTYYTQYSGGEVEIPAQAVVIEKATAPVNVSLSCSITHTYSSGILTGSTATVTATNNSSLPISSWDASLVNSDAASVRSTTGNTTFGTVSFSGTDYLSRQKKYTPVGTCVVSGDVLNCASAAEYSAPNPNISVVSGFETSYTRYLAGNISSANQSGTGNKAMNLSVTVNVSEDLLSKFSNSLSFTYDGHPMLSYSTITSRTHYADQLGEGNSLGSMLENNGTSSASIISQNPGQHTVAASFMFDGVTTTDSDACHITGIPYSISFNDNSTPEGWSLNNNGKTSGYLTLERGSAYAITPAFHIPGNINVTSTLTAYAYGGSIYSSYKPTVAIHASESGQNATANATLQGSNALPGTASFKTITNSSIQLTTSVKKICIYTNGTGSSWSVGGGDMGVVCKDFSTQYR